MDRIKWEYFMAQSHLLIAFYMSKTTVGATIVKDNRIIAGGYNGSVSGEAHCIDEDVYWKMVIVFRDSRRNECFITMRKTRGVNRGATIYVTHFLVYCTKSIIQAGIKQFIMLKITIIIIMLRIVKTIRYCV